MTLDEMTETFGPISNWDSIGILHEKFGLRAPDSPVDLPVDVLDFRINFMREELKEYEDASTLEDQIDALVDLVVVAMGTAYLHGFDWEKHWHEVFMANMKKERVNSADQSKRGHAMDLRKPEGWKAPNHTQHFKG